MSMYQPKIYRDQSGDRMTIKSGGELVLKSGALISNEDGIGAAAGTGNTVTEKGQVVNHTRLTLASLSVTMTDATTAGNQGGTKIYDFPAGNIVILGATCDLTTLAGVGGIADTGALVGALGSVVAANDNATLLSTEANVIPSMTGTLTAGAGVLNGQSTGLTVLDGTATPADLYLNLAVPDAGSSGNDTVAVSGTIDLFWINTGDN